MTCAWFAFVAEGKEPPSWQIARRFIADGKAGMLVPSFVPGATADDQKLVLWSWSERVPRQVSVFDPSGRLPKDQLSWT